MNPRTVLVTGATGNQGGAVTNALLERGMKVHALVRDPLSTKAQALSKHGVELVKGNLNDQNAIKAAAKGMDALFMLTTPFVPGVGIQGEIQQGRSIIDALKGMSIAHIVYSSVSDADRYLKDSGLPVTITGPVFFSDNILLPWNLPDLKAGRFRQPLPSTRKLQLVSLRDIGRFNAEIIERGPKMAGRRFNYAGDDLTPLEMANILTKVTGRTLEFQEQPMQEMRTASEEMAIMYEWFERVGYSADIRALRTEFPEVGWMSFEEWAKTQNWEQILS